MSKRVAIITGASGGIGKEFTKLLLKEEIDEIWAIARNEERLKELKREYGDKIIPLPKDLSRGDSIRSIEARLQMETPMISYLINNAGIAKMGSYRDFSLEEIEATISINCTALASLCAICIPYMRKGSKILNISSASSFQPLPYLNLYAATKVFERSYSRALHAELKGTGITCTAVCPSWVDTDLLMRECNGKPIKFPGLVTPERVVKQAMRDAKKGKDMSICTTYVKALHLSSKLCPQKLTMSMWIRKLKNL